MIAALMQPYLFPYLGSFSLVAATDRYVVFDNVQYIRRGWMHRNRVHKPGGGWQYLGVPVVKAPRAACIHEIRLNGDVDWRGRLRSALESAYGSIAPRFEQTMALVEAGIGPPVSRLVDLNERTFGLCCEALGLAWAPVRATDLGLQTPEAPSGWAVAACRALGADRYVNPPGGADLYPAADFVRADLGLGILRPELVEYDRGALAWEPGLSVLDALMFQPPAAVRGLVDRHTVEWRTGPEAAHPA